MKGTFSFISGFLASDMLEGWKERFCSSASATVNGATINPYLDELKLSHELLQRLRKQEMLAEDLHQTVENLYNYMFIIYATSSTIIVFVCLASICCYLIGIRRERRCRLESDNEEMKQRIKELEKEAVTARAAQRTVPHERPPQPILFSVPGLSGLSSHHIPGTATMS